MQQLSRHKMHRFLGTGVNTAAFKQGQRQKAASELLGGRLASLTSPRERAEVVSVCFIHDLPATD